MPRRITSGLQFALALALLASPLAAQMHHVDQPQRVTRALGVYEWTGDMAKPDAERLIPVSIFIDGHFEDAGVFLAQPIPLALETGNVYAIQRSGDPIGTVDLDYARDIVDRRDVADDNPLGAWYGYGRFLPLSAQPKPALHPASHLSQIASSADDDSQPHFINRSPGEAGNPSTPTSSTPGSTSASTPAPPDDPDRPILHRAPNSGSDSTADNAPQSPGTDGSATDDDPERPTLGHRDEQPNGKHHKHASDGGAVIPMSTSLNDDPNRPMLHRGKVQSEQAPPQLTGTPPNLHQAVAISDATILEPHVFSRPWDSLSERAQTLAAMQKLAQPFAQQYMATNHLQPAPLSTGPTLVTKSSRPSSTKSTKTSSTTHTMRRTAHHTTYRSGKSTQPQPPAPLPFHDEQLTGFTLSYGGLPTFVYSAGVPTAGSGPEVRLTLVAQRLPSGELQVSLHSVTDDAHLDRTPWMRLVDAVDADASHRASLLFELRERASRQFALYSLAYAQAQQTFVTGIIE